jgi:hypothetical protein
VFGLLSRRTVADWAFEHYLRVAPPQFAGPPPSRIARTPDHGARVAVGV